MDHYEDVEGFTTWKSSALSGVNPSIVIEYCRRDCIVEDRFAFLCHVITI